MQPSVRHISSWISPPACTAIFASLLAKDVDPVGDDGGVLVLTTIKPIRRPTHRAMLRMRAPVSSLFDRDLLKVVMSPESPPLLPAVD